MARRPCLWTTVGLSPVSSQHWLKERLSRFAASERAEHELQAHFLEPFSGVQTPGLTRWIRKSHGLSQNLAVSVLMRGHGAVFVREDDQNVWLLQYKPTYECAYK